MYIDAPGGVVAVHIGVKTQCCNAATAMNNPTMSTNPVLQVRLSADYANKPDVLRDLSFEIGGGELLGLVGESGSGKSTLALAILGLLGQKAGTVRGELIFGERHLESLTARRMRHIRGKEIGLVLQSAVSSLNPALRIGAQFAEAWKAHESVGEWRKNVFDTFERVRLPADEEFLRLYPRQLSVGQAQRVLIALAILHRPTLLIADEPTSALDVITKAEVVSLLKHLNSEMNMAVLFISHDLELTASLCGRIAILKDGEIIETGSPERIFGRPEQLYTQALIRALRMQVPISASKPCNPSRGRTLTPPCAR